MINPSKTALDKLTYEIIGAAIHLHKVLGPGLLESIYHECMKISCAAACDGELEDRGINFRSEYRAVLVFNGRELETQMVCDLLVEDIIVVELKAVATLLPVHNAQVLSYMKIFNVPKGILINFHCAKSFARDSRLSLTNYSTTYGCETRRHYVI